MIDMERIKESIYLDNEYLILHLQLKIWWKYRERRMVSQRRAQDNKKSACAHAQPHAHLPLPYLIQRGRVI